MSELLTMASGPPSRQTLTELLATLPAPAALCDETLQWLTANEAYHQLFPDRAAGAQLERLRAAGLDRQLAMQPAARHFVVEAVSADAGHASQPTGRIRLKVDASTAPTLAVCAGSSPRLWNLPMKDGATRSPIGMPTGCCSTKQWSR